MGPAPRERHNAKSRQSTAGSRKKGKRKRQDDTETGDANALIHVPKTNEERELTRREKLKQEVRRTTTFQRLSLFSISNSSLLKATANGAARKRNVWRIILFVQAAWTFSLLITTITGQEIKEGRTSSNSGKTIVRESFVSVAPRFMFLSQSQAQITNTLHLQSSSTLGTGRVSTHRERLDKLEDIEVRKALDGRVGKRKRNDEYSVRNADEDEEDDTELYPGNDSPLEVEGVSEAKITDIIHAEASAQPTTSTSTAVGSALQRNPDGTVVAPRIRSKRQKTKVETLCVASSWTHLVILISRRSVVGRNRKQSRKRTILRRLLIAPTLKTILRTKTNSRDWRREATMRIHRKRIRLRRRLNEALVLKTGL